MSAGGDVVEPPTAADDDAASTAGEIDMDLLEKYDKKLRRQIYMRNMRQLYRNEEKEERIYLLNKVDELERILVPIVQRRRSMWTLMPWKDIAEELCEEQQVAAAQLTSLQTQVCEYEALVRQMQHWVATNTVLKCSLDGRVSTWRDSSLLANPQSRQLGKAWITQHLYHNVERMFLDHGFPPTDTADDFHLFDMHFAPGGVQFVLGGQFDLDIPPDALASIYCQETCSVLMANFQHPIPRNTIKEEDGTTRLHQMVTANGEFVNVLTTCFQETGRFVAVVQDIMDDETIPLDDRFRVRRYRTYWAEMVCLPSGQWKRRFLYLFSQRCGPSGPTPLKEEALIWGCNLQDVAPDLHEARFRHEFMKMCARLCAKGGFFHPKNAVNRRR
ncbi:Aste57867_1909 [Aphanomyces stellatus]|uniref:Aste57867_1909 protein n=1 Tax=Aphanomyces stellatus TaxID=120398 RepID=A0A485K6E8_9STRA|nr:hypothetical protein As57867_001907 [Aphanomyces stellatus]VFT79115.1 Aste57867_1909 [Aphanomyces stellatus]